MLDELRTETTELIDPIFSNVSENTKEDNRFIRFVKAKIIRE